VSVRVNLLPGDVAERNRAARQRAGLAGAGVALLVLFVLAFLFQLGRVNDARDELALEEARVGELEAELGELREFEELQAREAAATTLLRTAFGDEASVAGILQDLAAVYPTDAQLETLTIALTEPSAELGATRVSLGRMTATGATLQGHAPGLERILLELDKVAAFSNVFFTNSNQDAEELGIAAFTLDVDLGPEIRTLRYVDGLPEELR
jgi:Tfp pilus assembly protein PilN